MPLSIFFSSFEPCSARIFSAVSEMASLFPDVSMIVLACVTLVCTSYTFDNVYNSILFNCYYLFFFIITNHQPKQNLVTRLSNQSISFLLFQMLFFFFCDCLFYASCKFITKIIIIDLHLLNCYSSNANNNHFANFKSRYLGIFFSDFIMIKSIVGNSYIVVFLRSHVKHSNSSNFFYFRLRI